MATEPLEYKVTFDTSEVAQKLSEVKNAMDVAFGAQAFNAAGPDIYPFRELFQSSALTNLTGAAPISFGVPESLTTAMTSAREGVQMARSTFGDVQNIFNSIRETGRLGYSKFTRDLEMAGLMTGGMRGAPQPMAYGELMQQIKQDDWLGDITGGMGVGYSPTMPMSKKEYTRAYRNQAMEDFMEPSWGEAGGVALGFAAAAAFGAGPIGWTAAAIPAVALGAKAALYPFTSELRHQRALEKYVRGTSWRFLSGQFNREDAEGLGEYLRELPDQPDIAARGYGRSEIDEMLGTFTEAGGFDYVRTAQDYKEKTKQLFEGHRELMHTLHVSSKEAVALMGQLSRDLGVEDYRAFSAEVGVLSERAGLTRTEAASFMMKSAEMVKGTGYELKGFAYGAGRLLQDVRNMAGAGIISDEDLRQFGGAENISLNMARSAMNYAGSPIGIVGHGALMAAQLGGGGVEGVAGMGIGEQLAATAGAIRTPMDLIRLVGGQRRFVDAMGPELLNAERAKMWLQRAQMVGGQKIGSEDLLDFYITQGLGMQEAKGLVATRDYWANNLTSMADKNNAVAAEALRQRAEEGETPAGKWLREVGALVESEVWKPITGRAEKLYTGIEQGMRVGGEAFGRFTYDITQGAFAMRTTKLAGLELAYQLSGDYAERHNVLMTMNEEQLAQVDAQIIKDMGDSQLKVGKYRFIARTEEERRQRGLAAGGIGSLGADRKRILEQVGISELDVKEGRIRVEEYLENMGRESFDIGEMFDPGSFITKTLLGPLAPLVGTGKNILDWLGFESEASGAITEIAQALGPDVTREGVQANLARLAYMAAGEYTERKRPGETRDVFVKRRVLEWTKPWKKVYGKEGQKQLEVAIMGMPEEAISAIIGQGMGLKREEGEDYETMRQKIADEGDLELADVGPADVTAYLLETTKEEMLARQKAGQKYGEFFAKSMDTRFKGFERTNEAGGTVFDEASMRVAADKSIVLMSEAITSVINAGTNSYMRVLQVNEEGESVG
jgi:hypothetical protein